MIIKRIKVILCILLIALTVSGCGSKSSSTDTESKTNEKEVDLLKGNQEPVIKVSGGNGNAVAELNISIDNGAILYEDENIKVIFNKTDDTTNMFADVLNKSDNNIITKVSYELSKTEKIANGDIISVNFINAEGLIEKGYSIKQYTLEVKDLADYINNKYQINNVEDIRNAFINDTDRYMSSTTIKKENGYEIIVDNILMLTRKDGGNQSYSILRNANSASPTTITYEYPVMIYARVQANNPTKEHYRISPYGYIMYGARYEKDGTFAYDCIRSQNILGSDASEGLEHAIDCLSKAGNNVDVLSE